MERVVSAFVSVGAGGGDRTHTAFRPRDFKSRASASSATPAPAHSTRFFRAGSPRVLLHDGFSRAAFFGPAKRFLERMNEPAPRFPSAVSFVKSFGSASENADRFWTSTRLRVKRISIGAARSASNAPGARSSAASHKPSTSVEFVPCSVAESSENRRAIQNHERLHDLVATSSQRSGATC